MLRARVHARRERELDKKVALATEEVSRGAVLGGGVCPKSHFQTEVEVSLFGIRWPDLAYA